MASNNLKVSPVQNIARICLGLFLLFAGIGHLTFLRNEFVAQVPVWVPVHPYVTVVASGVVEVALGISLIVFLNYRIQIGYLTALFFILIFPGNIAQYVNGIDAFGLDSDENRFIRLFFQPVLIAWALWCTGAWTHFRKKYKF